MTRTTATITLVAGVALAATLAACTKNGDPPVVLPSATSSPSAASTPAPTATPVPSATPTGTPQQQVLAAYLGMQNAYVRATELADPAHLDLAKYAGGDALRLLTNGLQAIHDNGLRGRGVSVPHPRVESLQPANAPVKARVRDCMDTSKSELYKANGDPYKDTPGGLRLVIADLERLNGVWKVTGLGVHEVGSCKL